MNEPKQTIEKIYRINWPGPAGPLSYDIKKLPFAIDIQSDPDLDWLRIEIFDENKLLYFYDVETKNEESFNISLDKFNTGLSLVSESRQVLAYVANNHQQPLVAVDQNQDKLAFAVLMDATCYNSWQHEDNGSELNKAYEASLKTINDEIKRFLALHQTALFSALSFYDMDIDLRTPLTSSYALDIPCIDWLSTENRFVKFSDNKFDRAMAALKKREGFDYIDELASGLEACSGLPWPKDAKKVLLVIGNSPGYSLIDPAPATKLALPNIGPRRFDIDTYLTQLKQQQITILSIYIDYMAADDEALPDQINLARWTKDQYKNMASTPAFAFNSLDIDDFNLEELLNL